jgi:putative PIN family toxin of toxin-antitoxin system
VTSELILEELITVLRRSKFKTSDDEIYRIIIALIWSSEVISVKSRFEAVKKDPKDDMVINTAHDGRTDMIVTGDKHFLELENFRGIKIITVESMLELLQKVVA